MHCCCDKGLEEDRGTLDTGLESSSSSSSCEIYHRKSMLSTPRKLSIIRETVAIVEPPIEDPSSSEINAQSSGMSPKINHSQPDLQLILNMPYGSFLGIIKKKSPSNIYKSIFSSKYL